MAVMSPVETQEDLNPFRIAMRQFDTAAEKLNLEPGLDRKSTRLNSSHIQKSRMPSSA